MEGKLNLKSARSRLYRHRFLRPNTRWKALDEIYKFHILIVTATLIFKSHFHQISSKVLNICKNVKICQLSFKGMIKFQFSFILQLHPRPWAARSEPCSTGQHARRPRGGAPRRPLRADGVPCWSSSRLHKRLFFLLSKEANEIMNLMMNDSFGFKKFQKKYLKFNLSTNYADLYILFIFCKLSRDSDPNP